MGLGKRWLVLAAAWVSGCAFYAPAIETFENVTLRTFDFEFECEERDKRQLEGVDFSTARTINVRVRNNEFSPMVIRMAQNRPYVLRIRNRDDVSHVFSAPKFFDNVAIAAIAVDNDLVKEPCLRAVWLGPGQTVEILLLTLKDGHYVFEDKIVPLPNLPPYRIGGIINVDEAT